MGKGGVRMVRGWKRVKVHGRWVVQEGWVPAPDNPFADFLGALAQGVADGMAQGMAEGMGVDPVAMGADPDGMDGGDDPVYAEAYVAFARAHHLRRGPHGYNMSPALKAEFQRSQAGYLVARNAARASRGGGGGGRRK